MIFEKLLVESRDSLEEDANRIDKSGEETS